MLSALGSTPSVPKSVRSSWDQQEMLERTAGLGTSSIQHWGAAGFGVYVIRAKDLWTNLGSPGDTGGDHSVVDIVHPSSTVMLLALGSLISVPKALGPTRGRASIAPNATSWVKPSGSAAQPGPHPAHGDCWAWTLGCCFWAQPFAALPPPKLALLFGTEQIPPGSSGFSARAARRTAAGGQRDAHSPTMAPEWFSSSQAWGGEGDRGLDPGIEDQLHFC